MELEVRGLVVILRDADDCRSLVVRVYDETRPTLGGLVEHPVLAERLSTDSVVLAADHLHGWASRQAQAPEWERRCQEMVAYAAQHDWVTEDGGLKAHVEWKSEP